jgi:hypothetical protein
MARRAADDYAGGGGGAGLPPVAEGGQGRALPANSLAGGSVRRTLQAMHGAHKVLMGQAELLRSVFPPGLSMTELTERARQRSNTAGAPDVLNFIRWVGGGVGGVRGGGAYPNLGTPRKFGVSCPAVPGGHIVAPRPAPGPRVGLRARTEPSGGLWRAPGPPEVGGVRRTAHPQRTPRGFPGFPAGPHEPLKGQRRDARRSAHRASGQPETDTPPHQHEMAPCASMADKERRRAGEQG